MINIDNNIANSDWLKQRTWDLPTTVKGFLNAIGGADKWEHFKTLPAYKPMPESLRHDVDAHVRAREAHKSFNPDQPRDENGRFTDGGASVAPFKDSDERRAFIKETKESFDWEQHPFAPAVKEYRNYGFSRMNRSMRNERWFKETESAKLQEKTAREVNYLKTVIEDAPPLSQDILTYRGIKYGDAADELKSLGIGDTFEDKGFSSTTLNKDTAIKEFSSFDNIEGTKGVTLEIINPAGTKGLMVADGTLGDAEEEWLLPPSRYEVVEKGDDLITVRVRQ